MLKLPAHHDTLEDADEKSRIRSQVERSLVTWKYELDTKRANPLLHEIFHLPQGRTRRETVEFSANTWNADIIHLGSASFVLNGRLRYLISLSVIVLGFKSLTRNEIYRHWNEFNNTGEPCPFTFAPEEIKTHIRDGDGWNENADFWASLEGFVRSDGWISNENFE